MNFAGQIEDFPVLDLMQYLHTSRKNGTLNLSNGPEKGWVHFQDGQIIRVRRPGMINLGDLLLQQGQIQPNDLNAAVRIQKTQPKAKPLGMILEEMGTINRHSLREAVVRQIQEVVYELVTWEEGAFGFELENNEVLDDISVAPDDLIPPEEIDTKLLLIEAMRAFEAIKHPEPARPDHPEAPDAQALSAGSRSDREEASGDVPPASTDGFENVRRSLFLLKKMLLAGRGKDNTQSISLCFLKILSEHLDRAILFMVRRSELLGLGAFGKTLDFRSLDREIKNLRISLAPGSLPARCIESRSPFLGEPNGQPWLTVLQQRIGAPLTSEAMILPVAGMERVICMVYGDNGALARPIEHLDLLEIAAGQAGMIFENASLRKHAIKKDP